MVICHRKKNFENSRGVVPFPTLFHEHLPILLRVAEKLAALGLWWRILVVCGIINGVSFNVWGLLLSRRLLWSIVAELLKGEFSWKVYIRAAAERPRLGRC